VDPIIDYDDLPFEFQTAERQLQTDYGAERRFMLDFTWDKLVVPASFFLEILSGTELFGCHLTLLDIRMGDIPLDDDEDEKRFVVTEILSYRRLLFQQPSGEAGKPDIPEITCSAGDYFIRDVACRSWLLGELEVCKYGEGFTAPFPLPSPDTRVLRIGIAIYDDDFNAYRGVYHGIGGVYLCVLNLGWYDSGRHTLRNIHPLMFIPHAAERSEIYHQLEKELKKLECEGMYVTIRGTEYLVFVKLLLQITDMPQGITSRWLQGTYSLGNLLARVRKPTAFLPCRCCLVSQEELEKTDFDYISLGRYRRRMNQLYRHYERLCEEEELR
jgi:hypothetical protein